jgi:hypothetical protein
MRERWRACSDTSALPATPNVHQKWSPAVPSWKTTALLRSLLLAGSIAVAHAAFAQTPAPVPSALLDQRMANLQQRLGLTSQQEPQVRHIQSNHLYHMVGLIAEMQEQDARRKRLAAWRQRQALRKETTRRMAAVLSPQQMTAYEAFLNEQEAKMRERLKERQGSQK